MQNNLVKADDNRYISCYLVLDVKMAASISHVISDQGK